MLDCFAARSAEVKPKWMAKIAHGEVYPRLFIVSSQSPSARNYDPRVCERYHKEEKEHSKDLETSLKWNDNACIKIHGCI